MEELATVSRSSFKMILEVEKHFPLRSEMVGREVKEAGGGDGQKRVSHCVSMLVHLSLNDQFESGSFRPYSHSVRSFWPDF